MDVVRCPLPPLSTTQRSSYCEVNPHVVICPHLAPVIAVLHAYHRLYVVLNVCLYVCLSVYLSVCFTVARRAARRAANGSQASMASLDSDFSRVSGTSAVISLSSTANYDNDSERSASASTSASGSPMIAPRADRMLAMMSRLDLAAHMLQTDDDEDADRSVNLSPLPSGRCRAESIASALGSSFDDDQPP